MLASGLIDVGGASMADDLSKRGPQDGKRININESYEVKAWCSKYGCTKARLVSAVAAVGPMSDKVEKYLKDHGKR
jgi:hypothetical protein